MLGPLYREDTGPRDSVQRNEVNTHATPSVSNPISTSAEFASLGESWEGKGGEEGR